MSKGSIIVYKGKFIYDVVNVFADLIAEGFRQAGCNAVVIDLAQGASFLEELKPVVEKGDCKLIFSFGAAGAELALADGRLLHDAIPVPFLAAMVDHPAHFISRFALKRLIVGCFDESHCEYMALRFGGAKRSFVLPHGGCPPPRQFEGAFAERPHKVVFPASFLDPEPLKRNMSQLPGNMRSTGELALRLMESCDCVATHKVLAEAARAFGVDCSKQESFAAVMDPLFSTFELLVRSCRRLTALIALDQAGVPVEIYGKGWPEGLFKSHKILPPLSFNDTLDLMARSQIVLNMRAIPGPHERVISAAMGGALVLSDFNDHTATQFQEGKEIAFFHWDKINELPGIVEGLLADPAKMERMAEAAKLRAFAEHTWSHRAKLVLSTLSDVFQT